MHLKFMLSYERLIRNRCMVFYGPVIKPPFPDSSPKVFTHNA